MLFLFLKNTFNFYFLNMKSITLLIFCFLTLILNAQIDEFRMFDLTKLKKHKLKIDSRNFKSLMKYIKANDFNSFNQFRKNVKEIKKYYEEDSLGFNAKRYSLIQNGWYTSSSLTLSTFENRIQSFNIFIDWESYEILKVISQKDTTIKKDIDKYWRKNKGPFGIYLTLNYENDTLLNKYKNTIEKEFGQLNKINTDSFTQKLVQFLINPLSEYGYDCDFLTALDTFSITHWERLTEITIIKNVLKGYNPIGRVLAVEKILTLSKDKLYILTQEDVILIKKVIYSDIEIGWCRGDLGGKESIKDLFKEYKLRELLRVNNIF